MLLAYPGSHLTASCLPNWSKGCGHERLSHGRWHTTGFVLFIYRSLSTHPGCCKSLLVSTHPGCCRSLLVSTHPGCCRSLRREYSCTAYFCYVHTVCTSMPDNTCVLYIYHCLLHAGWHNFREKHSAQEEVSKHPDLQCTLFRIF
jgi:hypothetical protein